MICQSNSSKYQVNKVLELVEELQIRLLPYSYHSNLYSNLFLKHPISINLR